MTIQLKIPTGYLLFSNEQFQVVHTRKKWYDGELFSFISWMVLFGFLIKRASDSHDYRNLILGLYIALVVAHLIKFGFFLRAVFVKRRNPVTDTIWVKDIRKIKIKPTLFGNRVIKVYHHRNDVYRVTAHRVDLDGMNFAGQLGDLGIAVE
ncbi:hypothetical protein [Sediminibacterium goheungense]|uniref:Uncharacterized protein n=1 Tax=Sediminibacterium goheungense TaxID=1086393 RepID=A0A4R6IV54_9BACT|nr:hypothetical protein [Sediminibacterium goheungense]TDO26519.1 hypothetical protein BC659_1825 [Sediminibacterium goheungense]